MKKQTYVAPTMTVLVVELECGFMAGSLVNDAREGVYVQNQNQSFEEIDFGKDSFEDKLTWE